MRTAILGALVFIGLITVIITAALIESQVNHPDPSKIASQDNALARLDEGNFAAAKALAVQLHKSSKASYEDIGVAAFVLGSATAHEAEDEWNRRRRKRLYLIASRYLEEALERGFPSDREAVGLHLLGLSLYRAGRLVDSIPVLEEALVAETENAPIAHRLLADAHSDDAVRDYDRALQHIQQFLSDPKLSLLDHHDGRITESRIRFKLGERDGARQILAQIPDDSPMRAKAILMQARMLLDEGVALLSGTEAEGREIEQAKQLYNAAVDLLESAKRQDTVESNVTAAANYLLGLIQQRNGELDVAEQFYSETRRLSFDSPVGLAAGLGEADVQRMMGNYDAALPSYLRVLKDAGSPETFGNPWISLTDFRARIHEAYRGFWEAKRFPHAIQLAETLGAMFPPSDSLKWQADGHRDWADRLIERAANVSLAEAKQIERRARKHYRSAGRLYEQLAQLRFATRMYPEDLWESADCFFRGNDFSNTVRMTKKYLPESPRNRQPRAQVMLGEAYFALNQLEPALDPLLRCTQQSPNHPDSYRGRQIAADVYLEMNNVEAAKAILINNLESGSLTPESLEWRNSLFALGRVLFREGAALEAQSRRNGRGGQPLSREAMRDLELSYRAMHQSILKLDEFVKRYGAAGERDRLLHDQLIQARYSTAEAYRQGAKLPRKKLQSVDIETTRAALIRQMQTELNEAGKIYHQLEIDLQQRADEAELSELETAILRNCYFARADCLFDMGRYEDAINAYSSATNRYHDRPEALEAFVQIAACYRRLNQFEEAEGILHTAKVVLGRIDSNANFAQTTRYDREQWTQLLDWLSTM